MSGRRGHRPTAWHASIPGPLGKELGWDSHHRGEESGEVRRTGEMASPTPTGLPSSGGLPLLECFPHTFPRDLLLLLQVSPPPSLFPTLSLPPDSVVRIAL